MDAAADLSLILGQGRMGQALRYIASKSQATAVKVGAGFSRAVLPTSDDEADAELFEVAAIARMMPAFIEGGDLAAASVRLKESAGLVKRVEDANAETQSIRAATAEFAADARQGISQLHDLYHTKLALEAPATYWARVKVAAAWRGWTAFAAFILLVGSAAGAMWANWDTVSSYLLELVRASNSQFSLTPVVIISVPVLAFGWLLRHISRIFIQNLALADDAEYRRVMTMAFLGLRENDKSSVTETERALILNALFRPAPPHTNEDGPPSGLLDLVRGKAS